jgi:hypothetical protein
MAKSTATLPCPNRLARVGSAGFLVIANPESRRLALFQAALARLDRPPATVLPYTDLLAGRASLERFARTVGVVRIESPGQNFEVEKALLAAGADVPDGTGSPRLSRDEVQRLVFDRGRILFPRQWYLGFHATLHRLEQELAGCPALRLMNRPADIALMFDKARCQARLADHGLPVPRLLGPVGSYEELRELIARTGLRRVFIKLAHGSSASGVVAYETDGRREQAFSSVELVRQGGEVRLYNSRRIRRYSRPEEVAAILDTLGPEGMHAEEWVPKAGLAEKRFDLRVVVIAGRARHAVVRLSRSPMTNLHLKNERGDLALLRARMGADGWDAVQANCERAAALFPESLYAGLDLVIAPGYRRHVIVEMNAFGDLLPGVTWQGRDTYTAEVAAVLHPSATNH